MTNDTAVDNLDAITFGMEADSLSQSGGVVLNGEVLQGDVVTLHLEGIGAEGAHRLLSWGGCSEDDLHIGMVVVGDDCLLPALAA